MHAAGAKQANDVQLRATLLYMLDRIVERFILKKAAVGNTIVDQRYILHHHKAGTKVEMPYLGIAHLAERQANAFLRRAEQRPWSRGAPLVDIRRVSQFDAIGFPLVALAPAIHDREQHRARPF